MCKTIDTATLLHSNESSSSSNSNPPDDDPCRMLFLPECFGFLGSSVDQTILAAEDDISRKTTTKTIKNGENISNALTRIVRHHATTGTNDHSREMDLDDVMLSDEEDRKLSLWDGLQTIAKASNLWISAGGMHVRAAATDGTVDGQQPRVYNTHVIVDNHGVLRAKYRKIHLFDVFIPGQVDLRESKSTQAGTELVACPDSPIGR